MFSKRLLLATVSMFLLGWCAVAEALTFPRLPARPQSIADLVPAGWQIDNRSEGDLNGDGRGDLAMVLLRSGPPVENDYLMFVVAFSRADGGYDLALEDHSLAARLDFYPYAFRSGSFAVARRTLRLTLECGCAGAGDSTEKYTFRWQGGRFDLIGFDYLGAARGDTLSASINYLTGVATVGKGRVLRANEKDDSYRAQVVHFARQQLLNFNDISKKDDFVAKQLCLVGVKGFCA